LIRSPIHKVLSTVKSCSVQFLLTGGQACILYGAAEFSRDTDIVLLASEDNIAHLQEALDELGAEQIFFPPLEIEYLERGHACHFRCHDADAEGARLDVLSRMRGCDPFPALWDRRTTFDLPDLGDLTALSLQDLVRSKKTQRDKDWPMLRRLVEVDYLARRDDADERDIEWWLAELRTPAYLVELARANPEAAGTIAVRPWLAAAVKAGEARLSDELLQEELRIRKEDGEYWAPLRVELEEMRRAR